MTNEEIAAMVADSTKETLKETLALANGILADNVRLSAENEALKNPKKVEPKVATDEELNKVIDQLMPEYAGLQFSKEKETRSSLDKTIDEMLKNI